MPRCESAMGHGSFFWIVFSMAKSEERATRWRFSSDRMGLLYESSGSRLMVLWIFSPVAAVYGVRRRQHARTRIDGALWSVSIRNWSNPLGWLDGLGSPRLASGASWMGGRFRALEGLCPHGMRCHPPSLLI